LFLEPSWIPELAFLLQVEAKRAKVAHLQRWKPQCWRKRQKSTPPAALPS